MSDVYDDFKLKAGLTLASLTNKVASSHKNRHIEITAVLFLRVLIDRLDGTFVWDTGRKYKTIFAALASKMEGYDDLGDEEKGDHLKEYAPKLRYGFYAARKWLNEWHNATIFLVPRGILKGRRQEKETEASIPTVLTLDPDFVLNEDGITAVQMQNLRDYKLVNGQLVASTKRLAAASSGDISLVKARLYKIMDSALEEIKRDPQYSVLE